MKPYQIRHHTEEAQCVQCGYPLYVGDQAIESKGSVYCCEPCVHEAESHDGGLMPVASLDSDYPG